MNRVISIIYFLTITSLCQSQSKLGNNWVTGYSGNRISFNSGNITTYNGIYFPFKYFHGGNSCISDSNGNLILVSDGFSIYNGNGQFLDEGDTLSELDYFLWQDGWSNESQTSIFLPMDNNKYYFVTPNFSNAQWSDCLNNNNCYFDQLLVNEIDMNANGGLGKVVKRMQAIVEHGRMRKTQMMACRHGNGKDWWLLKNEGDSANVHTFLFTQDSIYDKGVQVFNTPVWDWMDIRGQSTFNSDGTIFASTSHCSSCGLIFIADFDRCYGILSNSWSLQMPSGSQHNPNDSTLADRLSVGLCFSPNNKFLYVASSHNIYQYDLVDSSWYHVAELDTSAQKFQIYETLYMGADGKIYIGNFGGLSKQMSRIDNPDVKGSGCSFCPRCLRLDSLGSTAYLGTPPCMPNYALGARECYPLDTGHPVKEEGFIVYPNPVSDVLWMKNAVGKTKELYNSVGQAIFSTMKNEMDVSWLSRGVYYLRCGGEVRKVIIE